MTTTQLVPDWKTTSGRRVLLRVSALLLGLSLYTALLAVVGEVRGAWWLVAALALGALVLGSLAPEPVPSDLITGEKHHRT